MEKFLSSLYNYKLLSTEPKKEIIEITKTMKVYTYNRPDTRELPTMFSNVCIRDFEMLNNRFYLEKFCGNVFTIGSRNHAQSFCEFTFRTKNFICFIEILSSHWFVVFFRKKNNNY